MEDTVTLNKWFMVADCLPDQSGYGCTLASSLGHMLTLAEERFGPRDLAFTILGIELVDDGPRIWFPSGYKHIIIQLNTDCRTNSRRACYQLAHECVHLLSPVSEATVLEEGIAVVFQEEYTSQWSGSRIVCKQDKYARAASLTRQLLVIDPSAVKNLRRRQPVISHISCDLIHECYPSLSSDVANALTKPFLTTTEQLDLEI